MTGFFKTNRKAIEAPIRQTGCASCGLASGLLHPKMEPTGEGRKKILVVAEGPGRTEDEKGIQLMGKVGQRARRTFHELGIDLDRDCRKTNAVRCRPVDVGGGNRKPLPAEVDACRHHVFDEIRRFQPNVILLLGESAVRSLLGHRWTHNSDLTIGRWRGLSIPDHELGAWVCPTFHPSYVEREEKDTPAVDVIWRRDLARTFALTDEPLPPRSDPELIFLTGRQITGILLDLWRKGKAREIVERSVPYAELKPGTTEWIRCWKSHPALQEAMLEYQRTGLLPPKLAPGLPLTLAVDYETTGLKPYHPDHRIISCSLADSPDRAWAWMWADMDSEAIGTFRALMELRQVRKIAANMKFEQVWTRQKLGHKINGWWWDTMIAAHVLDNRRGNASVAFQSYAKLGMLGFKDDTQALLKAPDSNAFNQIDRISRAKLLERNALDSAYEFGICLAQREEFEYEDFG